MLPSPYRPGVGARPAVLVGRDAHLDRVRAVLAAVASTGRAAPAPIVFTGVRGIGKTVTLDLVADEASERGFLVVNVGTLDRESDNVAAVLQSVYDAVAAVRGRPAFLQTLRDRLTGLQIEVNAGVIKVASAAPDARAQTVIRRRALASLLVEAAELAVAHDLPGLVLLLDELQEAPSADLVVLTNALQDVLKRNAPLAVFGAGLPNTPDVLVAAASFTERFDFRVLDPLSRDEAYRALVEPALQLGVGWDADAAALMLQAAVGSPFLIQKFGDVAWDLGARHPGDQLSVAEAEQAIVAALASLEGMFRGRLAQCTGAQQEFLFAMAQVASPGGVAAIGEIAATLGRSVSGLSSVRKALIDKGLVRRAGHGLLVFAVPGFGQHLSAVEESGVPELEANS